jgi:hypothetical protein
MMAKVTAGFPPAEEFFLTTPLYQQFQLTDDNYGHSLLIEYFPGNLDAFCVKCRRETIFAPEMPNLMLQRIPQGDSIQAKDVASIHSHSLGWTTWNGHATRAFLLPERALEDRVFTARFDCMRDKTHVLKFIVEVENKILQKIGQSPSLADLEIAQLREYRPVLVDEKQREFTKAIGLAAHGVGIGSFVYLRRVFEYLIEQAHQDAVASPNWNEEEYAKQRVREKIEMLADKLPRFLVQNKDLYSILSLGVHELSEQQCLASFEIVKAGIELILQEKLAAVEQQKKIAQASKAIAELKARSRSS